ncbi:nuclear transport factor 2 family protein [Hoeflea prorocentri]|uniref:Nuclear transport factor 2 family protein n=1 Tax=Hoeflea prorocentri TaxID=1922333 RepID=A0A9X3ZJI0_9HYPH|nr:nuclear transport factor 2 family protein [Hoeflea prorocentri]MCY6383489.1 nuclear transport factor 2 family protein [Hoeflea prorocentri]MDA5401289.1 nuclear transport factor 2 family protein [Hoeflea prorocentri]
MAEDHPNVAALKRLDLSNLAGSADLISPDFVWHFFNPKLPDVEGDYAGLQGLQTFFQKMGGTTGGTFRVEPVSITAMGDELVVVHVRDRMTIEGESIVIDAVVVWRFVDGRIAEAWDIPSLHVPAAIE